MKRKKRRDILVCKGYGLTKSRDWFRAASRRKEALSNQEWLNVDHDTGEIRIYGDITPYRWFDEDVTAGSVYDQLTSFADDQALNVRLNTNGGSVFEGVAIYNLLREHKGGVTVSIDGAALSIGAIIAMAGDEVRISEGANFMIHDPWTFTAGSASELRKEAEILDTLKVGLVDVLARRSGKDKDDVASLMTDETWYSGAEAVEEGFADTLAEGEPEPAPAPEPEPENNLNAQEVAAMRQRLNERLAEI